MPEQFAFTVEAIDAAIARARDVHCLLWPPDATLPIEPPSMAMESILQAAWAKQEEGDHNVHDMRTIKAGLEREIERLRADVAELNKEWDRSRWAKLDLDDVARAAHAIRTLLRVTKKRRKLNEKFVTAWDFLNEWVQHIP